MQIDRSGILEKIPRLQDGLRNAQNEEQPDSAKVGLLRAIDALDYYQRVILSGEALASVTRFGSDANDMLDHLRAVEQELSAAIDCLLLSPECSLIADLEEQRHYLRAAIRAAINGPRGASAQTGSRSRGGLAAPPLPRKRVWVSEGGPRRMDSVLFGASAPAAVRAGQSFVVRFVAYRQADEDSVRRRLQDAGPDRSLHLGGDSSVFAPGSKIRVVLDGRPDVVGDKYEPEFAWTGTPVFLSFSAKVTDNWRGPSLVLKFLVFLEGIIVAKVSLELREGKATPEIKQTVGQQFAKTAFASYASADRARVLDRIASIRIAAGIDVFVDCLDLSPNEPWKRRLESEIAERELFMLFWSNSARNSGWVRWETDRAYDRKGIDGMQLHPLENGVKTPRKLRGIHVADPYVDLRTASLVSRPTIQSGG